jgi:hypothetical protein
VRRNFVSFATPQHTPHIPVKVKTFFPRITLGHGSYETVIEPLPSRIWMLRVTESLCGSKPMRMSTSVWFEVEL